MSHLDVVSRKIHLIKCWHNPMTTKEVSEKSGLKTDLINKYLKDRDNFDVAGVNIPMQLIKDDTANATDRRMNGKAKDDCVMTVHPIILPLNLTEVNMLTNGLLDILKENIKDIDDDRNISIYNLYKDLCAKIYFQLSDYGKENLVNEHYLEPPTSFYTSEQDALNKSINYITMVRRKRGGILKVQTKKHGWLYVVDERDIDSHSIKFVKDLNNTKAVKFNNDYILDFKWE